MTDQNTEFDTEREAELEKKYREISGEFNKERNAIINKYHKEADDLQAQINEMKQRAFSALQKVSEKYGMPVYFDGLSYAPNSFTEIHPPDLQEYIDEFDGYLDEDYGQEPGSWWAPSTC